MTRIVLIAALTAAATAFAAEGPDRIIFPHDLHFENEIDCATCHEAALTSQAPTDRLRPDMDICASCHDVESEDGCATCHSNVDEAGEYPQPTYGAARFAHAPHVARDIACATCHGAPTAPHPALPVKADCRSCHETADDYADCRLCHAEDRQLRPANHAAGWLAGHGICARDDENRCYQCHTRNTCQECHAGDNVRPRSHRLNYAYSHAMDARGNEMQCATCHQEPDYCAGCHIAEQVLPQDHSRSGWVSPTGGGLHATEGIFNLESCIACHSNGAAEPTCARCHQGE